MNAVWEHGHPTRVIFGVGSIGQLADIVQGDVLLVTSPGATQRGLSRRLVEVLGTRRTLLHDSATENPTVTALDRSIRELSGVHFDAVVAAGGGSAIDTGKVIALAAARGATSVAELLDQPSGSAPVVTVAVPTTAGTGSETTPFATVWDDAAKRKLSVAAPNLHPSVALVDPALASGLPWPQTLSSGLDAVVQCLESIWNRSATPVTNALAARGAVLGAEALPKLRDEDDVAHRSLMAQAALMSGLAISHTRTALAHSMSYPVTAHLGVPHGLACALFAPAVLEFNLEEDDGRLAELGRAIGLGGSDALLDWLLDLFGTVGVAGPLRERLDDSGQVEALASEMIDPNRADHNMRTADTSTARRLARRAWTLVLDR